MTAQVKAAEHREPLVRIAKRTDISRGKSWAIRAAAIVLALLLGALIMLLLGHNPFLVYGDMIRGSLGTQTGRRETVKIAVPLLGAGLAIAPAFMMKFWNIGAEGQILAGGIAATYFALFWADTLPKVPLLIVMCLAAAIAGALWGLIPAFFKAKWGTNETLCTLMPNSIAPGIQRCLRLPKVLGVHAGWIIVLIFVVLMFLYLRYTKQGYEIAVVGESEATARYSGMSVPKIVMRTMCISGAIAGIVGFTVVSGADYTLNANTAGGVGFTAITVAWLAGLNPIIMVFIAAFLAILTKGSGTIQTNFSIPASVADVLTGIILFAMLGCEFFIRYRLIFRGKGEHSNG